MLKDKAFLRLLAAAAFGAVLLRVLFGFGDVMSALGTVLELLKPVFLGILLAMIINVPMSAAERTFFRPDKGCGPIKDKLRRPVSLLMTLVILGGVLVLAVSLVMPKLAETVSQLSDRVPELAESLSETVEGSSLLKSILPSGDWSPEGITGKIESVLRSSEVMFRTLSGTLDIAVSLFSGLVTFVLALFFAVYMLLQKERLKGQARRVAEALLPEAAARRLVRVCGMCKRTFSDFIAGQTAEACILGLLCIVGMEIFGFPYALEVGVLVTVTAFIPVIGAFVGAAAGAFFIMFISFEKALWFLLFMAILQQLEDNLIYPRVVGRSVGLPPLWVLLAVTVGGSAGGILGMFISVPVCSVLYCLAGEVLEYLEERQRRKE
ncbi:Predicted PurR-regulated permease PerM [Ruminococcaceae bacterium FB2012]|nr:Predicted PurR-regulated permease PerM [Ruminococcaceae bacterium FB2012]